MKKKVSLTNRPPYFSSLCFLILLGSSFSWMMILLGVVLPFLVFRFYLGVFLLSFPRFFVNFCFINIFERNYFSDGDMFR